MYSNEQLESAAPGKMMRHSAKLVLAAGGVALLMEPSIAAAAPWDAAVGAIAGTLQGTLGKTIAIIAVITLGLMAMAGKLEWMTAIKVVIGVVIMFSAAQIINWLAPEANVSSRAASYQTSAACIAAINTWVAPVPQLVHSDGTIAVPYADGYCVDTKNGTDFSASILACKSTVKTAAGTIIANDNSTLTYWSGTSAIATAGGTCN